MTGTNALTATSDVVDAWVASVTRRRMDDATANPSFHDIHEAAALGAILFVHLRSMAERDEGVRMDLVELNWEAFERELDAVVRRWHEGAAKLAVAIERYWPGGAGAGIEALMLVEEVRLLGEAIKSGTSSRLRFGHQPDE